VANEVGLAGTLVKEAMLLSAAERDRLRLKTAARGVGPGKTPCPGWVVGRAERRGLGAERPCGGLCGRTGAV